MGERKGRSAPVVAISAVVAVAAADAVRRRRRQQRAVPAPQPWVPAGEPPTPSVDSSSALLVDDTQPDQDNGPHPEAGDLAAVPPKHRAPDPEPEGSSEGLHEPELVVAPEVEIERDPAPEVAPTSEVTSAAEAPDEESNPDWWHRDHPTFSALTGFFTGIMFLAVVPGVYAAILAQMVEYDRAEELFPFVLLTLIVPIGLAAVPRTRRFGLYMLLGILSTLLVVGGVSALVLYLLFVIS